MQKELDLPMPTDELRKILSSNGVTKAYVYGSYARGSANSNSDLDLLVELESEKTYLDLGYVQQEVESKYSIHTDISTKLNRHFEPYIKAELVNIL